MRFRLGTVLLSAALALGALGTVDANAVELGGPRLLVTESHPYPDLGSELRTVGPLGEEGVRIVGGSAESVEPNGARPAWSPDGKLVAFTGSAGEASPVFYVVNSDGTGLRLIHLHGSC